MWDTNALTAVLIWKLNSALCNGAKNSDQFRRHVYCDELPFLWTLAARWCDGGWNVDDTDTSADRVQNFPSQKKQEGEGESGYWHKPNFTLCGIFTKHSRHFTRKEKFKCPGKAQLCKFKLRKSENLAVHLISSTYSSWLYLIVCTFFHLFFCWFDIYDCALSNWHRLWHSWLYLHWLCINCIGIHSFSAHSRNMGQLQVTTT